METIDSRERPAETVPAGTAPGTPVWLREELVRFIPEERVLHRPIDLIAFASDASFYRLIPKAVVLASTKGEIKELFRYSKKRNIPLVFRAAGTSLSGQSITDGILVEVKRHWKSIRVEEGGKKVRVEPGAIGNHVNAILRPYRAKIGPDPASIHACAMGGILSNNSSGMCCGVLYNSYHTLDSLTFVLPSGTMIDTAHPDADRVFREEESELAETLLELKRKIEANEALAGRIPAKYKMKNTNGYALNAFIDFERPVDIFSHLLIGSEGTLAFIAEAVLNTVPDLPHKYTGLLIFADPANRHIFELTLFSTFQDMEVDGLPDYGTDLKNPNFAKMAEAMGVTGIRVEDPTEVRPAIERMLGHDGPVLVDVVTNPSELSMPPKVSAKQAGGFALYMLKETLSGHGDDMVEVIESNLLR